MSGNSSTGQILGTIVGAVIAYFLPGSYVVVGAAIGGAVGGAIDPPKGPNIVGPRLSDLSYQTASYGVAIPRTYGSIATQGNVFWLENNRIKETASKKGAGGKGGGGGGSITSYTYSATFAVGLCQGPIAGIRRIWIAGSLFYDAGSDDLESIVASNNRAQNFRVYTGSETQQPDARMQATLGVANTPAYRGLAYIVFDDLPLAGYGNSLMGAQVKVEIIHTVATENKYLGEYRSAALNNPGYGRAFPVRIGLTWEDECRFVDYSSHRAPRFIVKNYDQWRSEPLNLNPLLPSGYHTGCFAQLDNLFAVANYARDAWASGGMLIVWSDAGRQCAIEFATSGWGAYAVAESDGHAFAIVGRLAGFPAKIIDFSAVGYIEAAPLIPESSCISIALPESLPSDTRLAVDDERRLVLTNVGKIWKYNVTTETWTSATIAPPAGTSDSGPASISIIDRKIYRYWRAPGLPGVAPVPTPIDVIDYDTLALIETVYPDFIKSDVVPDYRQIRMDGDIIALAGLTYVGGEAVNLQYCKLRSIIDGQATLSDIVAEECVRSNLLAASDIDVTTLTDSVRGFRVTSVGAIRAAIQPLQTSWPFDVIQSGYKVKFRRRGGSTLAATITADDLDARAGNGKPGVSLTHQREMDSQLPRRIAIKYSDYAREYDQGEQYAERTNTPAVNIETIELPIVLTAAEAAQKAEILLYMRWVERNEVSFNLPPTFLHLEPADVVRIDLPGRSFSVRIIAITYTPDGRLEVNGRFYAAATYTSTAAGVSGPAPDGTIKLAGRAKYTLIDCATVNPVQDAYGVIAAMSGYTDGWPGGLIYRSTDDGASWSVLSTFADAVPIGITINSIGAPANSGLIDTASVLQVRMAGGELSSVTLTQLLNGANHFAYGVDGRWEIIAAMTCALQADGSYRLSNLLRGRFGTEHNMGNHAAGDGLILANDPDLAFATLPAASVGVPAVYRGITSGAAIDTATNAGFTYGGVNLKPLAPVWLNGRRNAGDWSLSWVRRTRIGGEWRDAIDAELGEASESYDLEIYADGTYASIKRTFSELTSAAATYTAAQQVTDFGSQQATLYVRIYQRSSAVGRGFPLITSITR